MEESLEYLRPPKKEIQELEISSIFGFNEEDYIKSGEKDKSVRKIYYNVEYDEFENNSIIEFEREIAIFPEGWEKEKTLRFIYASNFNKKEFKEVILN